MGKNIIEDKYCFMKIIYLKNILDIDKLDNLNLYVRFLISSFNWSFIKINKNWFKSFSFICWFDFILFMLYLYKVLKSVLNVLKLGRLV